MYPDDNYEPSGKVLPRILTGKGRPAGSDEIEAQLQATVRVWQTLQHQIQRGEDQYAEESGSFNIYKGWDGFIDARLFETMPKRFDHRWFSSSVSHTLGHQVTSHAIAAFKTQSPVHQAWPPAPSPPGMLVVQPPHATKPDLGEVNQMDLDTTGSSIPSKRKRAG